MQDLTRASLARLGGVREFRGDDVRRDGAALIDEKRRRAGVIHRRQVRDAILRRRSKP